MATVEVEWQDKWHENHNTLVSFARFLVYEMDFSGSEIIGVLEKPWHWTEQYELLEAYEAKYGPRYDWPMQVWHTFDAEFHKKEVSP